MLRQRLLLVLALLLLPVLAHAQVTYETTASTVKLNGSYTVAGGRLNIAKGANVAAANDLTLGTDGNVFHITGATQINAITTARWQAGSILELIFDSTPTVKHNTAGGAGTAVLLLLGAADFVAAANDVLVLQYDGTSWYEIGRRQAVIQLPNDLLFQTDNTDDIGASGATRPRTGHFGTSVVVPTGTFTTAVTTPSLNVNAGGAITALVSGTYTPTRSAETNLDANVTMSEAQYLRIGNTVTVSGRFTADPTAAAATSFEFSLPIASNLGAVEDLAGVAFAGGIAGQGAAILGSVANNTTVVQWVAVDVTSQAWSYTLSYQVI